MNVIQTNESDSPTIVDIWADMGLPAHGTALHELVRTGLSFVFLDRIASLLQVEPQVIATAICISTSTLARRAKAGRFNTAESDHLVAVAGVFREAIALFEGDVSAASGWMRSPVHGLGKCPLEMLETRVETQAVLDLIGRLENGVLT